MSWLTMFLQLYLKLVPFGRLFSSSYSVSFQEEHWMPSSLRILVRMSASLRPFLETGDSNLLVRGTELLTRPKTCRITQSL